MEPRIVLERDEDGWHAVVFDDATDSALFITNTYAAPFAAQQAARDWLKRKELKLIDRSEENEHCPRYVAFGSVDSYVESSDDLDELISILRELVDPAAGEDVVVWDGDRVAAVVLADGTVQRFDQRPQLVKATRKKRAR